MIAEAVIVATVVDSVEAMQVTLKSAVKVADVAAMMFNQNELKNQFALSAVSHRQSQSTMTGQLETNVQHQLLAQNAQSVQFVTTGQLETNVQHATIAQFAPIDIQRQNDLKNQTVQQR
jgi:filamentous hemagglutinin family protein